MARANDAELLVLYVKPPVEAREVFDPNKKADPATYLTRMPQRFPDLRTRTLTESGEPADAICRVAEEESVDTIVVGNRGTHDHRRSFLRAVPTEVIRRSPCSVVIVDTRRAQ